MKDEDKTKEQLISELVQMRQRIAELEASEIERKRAQEMLKESESKLNSIVLLMDDLVFAFDKEGRFTFYPPAKELYVPPEKFMGKKHSEVMPPDVNKLFAEAFNKNKKGEVAEYEYWLEVDGGIKWYSAKLSPLLLDGKFAGSVAVVRAITERKWVEEALRRQRDNLVRILEAMEDGVYIVNQQYDLAYVNLSLESQFGPVEGRKCYEYFHDREEVCPWCQNQAVFAGRTIRWESYFLKNQKTYDLIDTPLKNPDGSISKLGILHDITERKQMEEALRQERNKAQKYLDVAGVILVAIGTDQRVSLINNKGCEILEYKAEEIIGKNWFDNFLPERLREGARTVLNKLMSGEVEAVEYYESPVLTKSGDERLTAWHYTVLTDEAGNIVGTLGSGEDISERRRLWKKMVEYEELDRLKSELLSTVSHELRTPMATIKGYSTMIIDYDQRLSLEEKREYLQSIDKATDRLTDLVDRLLDMSRLGAGLLRLEKAPTNILRLIKEAVVEARVRAPKHRIVLKPRKRLPRVNIDAKRIRQVVDNIIDNASKYSRQGTEVVVSARRARRELLISIADQGVGIPAEELPRVFDRMYRVEHRLTPGARGTGLGLAISKGLVEAHGGRIWLESEEGKGSTCFFTLPLDTKEGDSDGEEG